MEVFIEANLGETMRLADLAARAGLSVHHFARAFKASTRATPRHFVEKRRIERARRLVVESGHPLAEIAIECGFGTQSRLTTAFRRHTGFTPARYRRGVGKVEERT